MKVTSLSGWSLKGRKKMRHSYISSRGLSLAALPRPIYLLLVMLALSRRAAGSDVIRIGKCIIFSALLLHMFTSPPANIAEIR